MDLVVRKMMTKVESSVLGAEFALKVKTEKELTRSQTRLENSLEYLSLLTRHDEVDTGWTDEQKSRVWNKLWKIDKVLGV
jgi:hypothetical protein